MFQANQTSDNDKPVRKGLFSAQYSDSSGTWIVVLGLLAGIIVIPILLLLGLYKGFVALLKLTWVGLYRLSLGFKSLIHFPANESKNIRQAPGTLMLRAAEFLCSPKTYNLTFKTLVADLQMEYFDALLEGRPRKAAWVRARYLFSYVKALGLSKVIEFIRSLTAARG